MVTASAITALELSPKNSQTTSTPGMVPVTGPSPPHKCRKELPDSVEPMKKKLSKNPLKVNTMIKKMLRFSPLMTVVMKISMMLNPSVTDLTKSILPLN